MIINSPIEVFEHTEKSEDFNFASKNEESDLGNSSNQISDSIDRKGQNSSDLEELKQITEKSKEHSDSDDANDSDHKVKEVLDALTFLETPTKSNPNFRFRCGRWGEWSTRGVRIWLWK